MGWAIRPTQCCWPVARVPAVCVLRAGVDRGLAGSCLVAGSGSGSRPGRWCAGAGSSWRSSSTSGRAGAWRGAAGRRLRPWSPDPPTRAGAGPIVVGEYERAFYGSQYALMAPLFEHYGVQPWLPEAGGQVDFASEHDERTITVLGLSSKREVVRTSIRVRTAMAAQTRDQGRYLGRTGRRTGTGWPTPGPTPTRRTPPGGGVRTALSPTWTLSTIVRWSTRVLWSGRTGVR